MKNKLTTTLLGLSLLVVPAARADRNNFDRGLDLAKFGTLFTVTGGLLLAGYKFYKNYASVDELKKENEQRKVETAALIQKTVKLETEVNELKERITKLEGTQTELVAILKTIKGQSEGFVSKIANLWNAITGNKKAALKA